MDTATNPNIGIPIMQYGSIIGYATSLSCANCGTLTHIGAMIRDRRTGEYNCTECPGEGWLRSHYGEGAVADLIAMREGRPDAPTLAELIAAYPEHQHRPTCHRGHVQTVANTGIRVGTGRHYCLPCADETRPA